MKLPIITAAFAAAIACSCTSESTQYNGYLLNSSKDSIYVHISGGDNVLQKEIGVGAGDTKKVYFTNADGDNELFDCSEILDSLWYMNGTQKIVIQAEESAISHTSELGADGTRVHACTLEIR